MCCGTAYEQFDNMPERWPEVQFKVLHKPKILALYEQEADVLHIRRQVVQHLKTIRVHNINK